MRATISSPIIESTPRSLTKLSSSLKSSTSISSAIIFFSSTRNSSLVILSPPERTHSLASGDEAPVNREHLPRDIRRVRPGQVGRQCGHLVRACPTLQGYPLDSLLAGFGSHAV